MGIDFDARTREETRKERGRINQRRYRARKRVQQRAYGAPPTRLSRPEADPFAAADDLARDFLEEV